MSEKRLVKPDNPVTSSIARISFSESGHLRVYFPEWLDSFREAAKGFSMRWKSPYWMRVNVLPKEKRLNLAAELASHLLSAGFYVKATSNIMDAAINGTFVPELRRYVTTVTAPEKPYDGWLALWWRRGEESDALYQAAKKLPGARWKRPFVVVPPENYESVFDFAERNEFAIKESAHQAANDARLELETAVILVPPKHVVEHKPIFGTRPERLDVPNIVEIDDDLLDKD